MKDLRKKRSENGSAHATGRKARTFAGSEGRYKRDVQKNCTSQMHYHCAMRAFSCSHCGLNAGPSDGLETWTFADCTDPMHIKFADSFLARNLREHISKGIPIRNNTFPSMEVRFSCMYHDCPVLLPAGPSPDSRISPVSPSRTTSLSTSSRNSSDPRRRGPRSRCPPSRACRR